MSNLHSFFEFVKAKPADEPFDHASPVCALGQWARSRWPEATLIHPGYHGVHVVLPDQPGFDVVRLTRPDDYDRQDALTSILSSSTTFGEVATKLTAYANGEAF